MTKHGPQVVWINSIEELRSVAGDWDDLWLRSDVTSPTARAAIVAHWVQSFTPGSGFHAVVVKDEDRFVAALRLVRTKVLRVLSANAIVANGWFPTGGGLLLDRERATDDVVDSLLGAIASLPHQLLWLDEVCLSHPHWQALRSAAHRAKMTLSFEERYPVGIIDIDHDWQAYRASWSRAYRRHMTRASRDLAKLGEVRLEVISDFGPDEVERQLRRGFEVEDRSWKGDAGSSVLAAGMFPYFVDQAKQLAAWGQLRLVYLTLDGRPIAFCYCFDAKGVYHIFKTAYDPEYAEYSPGMLMKHDLLEQLFQDERYRAVDMVGLLTNATAHWRPRTYIVGTLMIAPRRTLGRLATIGHQRWQALRRLKARLQRTGRRS
jgi:CelD/BcsL family acetyltransferase involved in cellulose biosynthesis